LKFQVNLFTKEGLLYGTGEFSIYKLSIMQREEMIKKTISINPILIKNRSSTINNTILNSIKIVVNVYFSYIYDDEFKPVKKYNEEQLSNKKTSKTNHRTSSTGNFKENSLLEISPRITNKHSSTDITTGTRFNAMNLNPVNLNIKSKHVSNKSLINPIKYQNF